MPVLSTEHLKADKVALALTKDNFTQWCYDLRCELEARGLERTIVVSQQEFIQEWTEKTRESASKHGDRTPFDILSGRAERNTAEYQLLRAFTMIRNAIKEPEYQEAIRLKDEETEGGIRGNPYLAFKAVEGKVLGQNLAEAHVARQQLEQMRHAQVADPSLKYFEDTPARRLPLRSWCAGKSRRTSRKQSRRVFRAR